jgi:hypothetical protein
MAVSLGVMEENTAIGGIAGGIRNADRSYGGQQKLSEEEKSDA